MRELLAVYNAEPLYAEIAEECNDAGIHRLKFLPNQELTTLEGKKEVADTLVYIQSPSKVREQNPVGTILQVEVTEKWKDDIGMRYVIVGPERMKVVGQYTENNT